ncbi:MAG: DUF3786 domain-containing protein [Deltaproteobacteria bacterium]|nr:DUF3786 domain-containing protein [Deltaproteobacteria bacterium]
MPRMDDYVQAVLLGKAALTGATPDLLARLAGAEIRKESAESVSLLVPFLNDEVSVTWDDLRFQSTRSGQEPPIQQQILLLHYLKGAWASGGAVATGQWISFQEIPDGRFYMDAFQRRAKNPLVQAFGEKPERLIGIAGDAYGAVPLDQGDFSVVVKVLPLVPMALVLWRGDEEFPPEGNILFDRNISAILSAEDIAWLAGMVVYPLAGMATQRI